MDVWATVPVVRTLLFRIQEQRRDVKNMDTEFDRVNPVKRVAYTFVGLLAGDAMSLLYFLIFWSRLPERIVLLAFAVVSFVGWLFVGLTIALFLPARSITRLSWPQALVVGGALGPVALFGALLTVYVGTSGLVSGLAHYSMCKVTPYAFSILISSVSFGVYAVLLRKQTRESSHRLT
jgi:hypothetical protein